MNQLKRHGIRLGVMLLGFGLGRPWFYSLLGFFNKHFFNRSIRSVFLLYPAHEKYTQAYTYLWYARRYKWQPILLSIFRQNKKWGLTFAISATERDFYESKNRDQLRSLIIKMESLRQRIGADQKTFAGILPGLFVSREIMEGSESPEKRTTIRAIQQALEYVKQTEGLSKETPVIILGGAGFIGKAFAETDQSNNYYPLDINSREYFIGLVEKFFGRPLILLNLTKKGALSEYIPYLRPGAIVLNEVYPEPSKTEVAAIKAKGASCYHISGVKGKAWPSFPRGYEGGIPCCASFLPDREEGGSCEIIVRKLE